MLKMFFRLRELSRLPECSSWYSPQQYQQSSYQFCSLVETGTIDGVQESDLGRHHLRVSMVDTL